MLSFICAVCGHKWKEFIKTGEEKEFHQGVAGNFEFINDIGYNREYKHCLRCGKNNPNYHEYEDQK